MPVTEDRNAMLPIGGIPFRAIGYEDTLGLFEQWIYSRRFEQVCIVNVHSLITACRDRQLHAVFCNAGLNTMDGQPLRWYANLVHRAGLRDRVCGPDLMLHCLERGQEKGWKHFLLGSTEKVLSELVERLGKKYPNAQVVGAVSPPFRPLNPQEDRDLLEQINSSGADFLWVGLGAPKQEKWIADHQGRLNVPISIGVGAAFDFHAGAVARAPEWMQRRGLEWFHRLLSDPRLWRRYLSTNPPFFLMLMRDFFLHRLLSRPIPPAC